MLLVGKVTVTLSLVHLDVVEQGAHGVEPVQGLRTALGSPGPVVLRCMVTLRVVMSADLRRQSSTA